MSECQPITCRVRRRRSHGAEIALPPGRLDVRVVGTEVKLRYRAGIGVMLVSTTVGLAITTIAFPLMHIESLIAAAPAGGVVWWVAIAVNIVFPAATGIVAVGLLSTARTRRALVWRIPRGTAECRRTGGRTIIAFDGAWPVVEGIPVWRRAALSARVVPCAPATDAELDAALGVHANAREPVAVAAPVLDR